MISEVSDGPIGDPLPTDTGDTASLPEPSQPPKLMPLRYAGTCAVCQLALPVKTRAYWHKDSRTVICVACEGRSTQPTVPVETSSSEELDRGTAGKSAQAEFERRHHKREERIDAKYGRLAGVVKFLSNDPQSTRAWAQRRGGRAPRCAMA